MMRASAVAEALLCGAAMFFASPAAAAAAATASASAANSSSGRDFGVLGPPPGFDDLANPREVLVDIYFGGQKIGSAVAVSRPGFLQFRDPPKVAALVPNLVATLTLATRWLATFPPTLRWCAPNQTGRTAGSSRQARSESSLTTAGFGST
jgi:hypothetical protein